MAELAADHLATLQSQNTQLEAAHKDAARTALLEHARMGRSVPESRDEAVVWITPAEIFARYGLDEFGRPRADTPDR